MTIHVKVFPISGITDISLTMDIDIPKKGTLKDLLDKLENERGISVSITGVMAVHNEKIIDLSGANETLLGPDDSVWLMPTISGG